MILTFILALNTLASGTCGSWYCIRNNNHSQPSLPNEFRYIENYDVYWCDSSNNEYNKEKVIYLTFDAGYENGNVEKILDVLKNENVSACFFVLDNLLLKNEALVKRMIDEGHTVGNHTLKHKDMTKLNKSEFISQLVSLEKLFFEKFNEKMPKFYRPPEGKFNEDNLVWAQELGYKTVMWSFAYADWDNGKQPSEDYAMKKILDNLHNGEVMLLHPTSKTNAAILSKMIKKLKDEGFRFGTVQELCE